MIFSSVKEHEKAQFPSVTFCKAFTYSYTQELIEDLDNWKNTSTSYVKQWAKNHTMDREKLFHFIHHPTESRQFPCDTVTGTGKIGHPCIFPFRFLDCGISNPNYPTKSYFCSNFEDKNITEPLHNCTLLGDEKLWCAVRTFANGSYIPWEYGYCSPSCKGELPSRDRPEYLAGPGFNNLWETRMFDTRTWGQAGLCHTYTPNETFQPGSLGHLYGLLIDNEEFKNLKQIKNLEHIEIYLHSSQVISYIKTKGCVKTLTFESMRLYFKIFFDGRLYFKIFFEGL